MTTGYAWESTEPGSRLETDGFYAVLLSPSGTVLWRSSVALVSEQQALSVARAVKKNRIRTAGLLPARSRRRTETVHLPQDGPEKAAEPLLPVPPVRPEPPVLQAPERPFDGGWARQVPGAELLADLGPQGRGQYCATLHDPRAPFTVRWRCAHGHPDWHLAEACALARRHGLLRLDGAVPAGSVTAAPAPEPDTVHVTPDAGVRVVVKAHAGSRVGTRCVNGALEVTVYPPPGDSEKET